MELTLKQMHVILVAACKKGWGYFQDTDKLIPFLQEYTDITEEEKTSFFHTLRAKNINSIYWHHKHILDKEINLKSEKSSKWSCPNLYQWVVKLVNSDKITWEACPYSESGLIELQKQVEARDKKIDEYHEDIANRKANFDFEAFASQVKVEHGYATNGKESIFNLIFNGKESGFRHKATGMIVEHYSSKFIEIVPEGIKITYSESSYAGTIECGFDHIKQCESEVNNKEVLLKVDFKEYFY